ncbi:MAG: hypothetical protein H9893_12875, partial [Candidatus Niameybacter stercoravium]|nr:hypothetical protein [Candidatus Niameybacter stercoravium]
MKSPVITNQEDREWLELLKTWPKHPCIETKWQNQVIGEPICIIKKPTEDTVSYTHLTLPTIVT